MRTPLWMKPLAAAIAAFMLVLVAGSASAQLNQVGRWATDDMALDLAQDGTFTLEGAPGAEGHNVLTGRYIMASGGTVLVMRLTELNRGERTTIVRLDDTHLDLDGPLFGGTARFERAFEISHILGSTVPVFIGLTVIVMGFAAYMTGQSLGKNWQPAWKVVLYAVGMAFADRFLHYALYSENLLSLNGLVVSMVVLSLIGVLSHRLARAASLAAQYPWLIERTGPLTWREKSPAP